MPMGARVDRGRRACGGGVMGVAVRVVGGIGGGDGGRCVRGGTRTSAVATPLTYLMLMTAEVSKFSGWLNAVASKNIPLEGGWEKAGQRSQQEGG